MVDYAKLIQEETARKGSAIAAAEAQWKLEIDLIAFFRSVEIALGEEMAKANVELKRRGAPTISGPFRPMKNDEKIELAFGTRRPCCRLTLQGTVLSTKQSAIVVELFDDHGQQMGKTKYVIEAGPSDVKAFRTLVEGFPDRAAEVTSTEIAQEIVSGIIRGRFV
jgi:endonuclease/exonuclease/phosphatase (EEP) superfamily protein YafD